MTSQMFSKMNEEQISDHLNGDNAVIREQARAEFAKRKARADAWHAGELALPVWNQPGVYKTKADLAAA